MTMLDRMRRHRNWLKWSLGLVCLAFVVFYIPDLMQGADVGVAVGDTDTVAVIDGDAIRGEEFRRMYQVQLQNYRAAYGGNMSEQLLKQLGIDQQILQQMVDERAALAEAKRLGLKVSDEEVAQRIYAIPAFQENGTFIGTTRYQQVLASQRPPLTPSEFEENVRRSIAVDKLRQSVTEWLAISDKELEEEYRRRNDKVKLALVAFNADAFRGEVSASDSDVSSYFDAHANDFKIPEKRKVKYILVDIDALRAKTTITAQDVENAYNENIQQYTTPEQIRASHILLRTEGKDDAVVKAAAEDVLKQVNAPNADFAALARKYSQDEANASNGGDLDFFGRGRMVPEFDAAAFALAAGQTSGLVKTEYGYHIIKLTDKKPGTQRTLEEVKPELTERLAFERAQNQAITLAEAIEPQLKKATDLEPVAKSQELTVQETGFFARDEPILGVGSAPEMVARAFSLNPGEVSGMLRTSRGFTFETLVEKKDAYVPKLDEVKDRVREEIIKQRARAKAAEKASALAVRLKSAPDFDKAAKAAGVDVKITELLARDAPIPDVGTAPELLDAAFKMSQGAVSDAVATDSGTAVFKVVEKVQTDAATLAANRETFRSGLLADRRNRFFSSYLAKAKQKMKIQLNREAVKRVTG